MLCEPGFSSIFSNNKKTLKYYVEIRRKQRMQKNFRNKRGPKKNWSWIASASSCFSPTHFFSQHIHVRIGKNDVSTTTMFLLSGMTSTGRVLFSKGDSSVARPGGFIIITRCSLGAPRRKRAVGLILFYFLCYALFSLLSVFSSFTNA